MGKGSELQGKEARSAAGPSAGTGAAAATTAERISGGDGKSRAVASFNEIDLDAAAFIKQAFFHQKG